MNELITQNYSMVTLLWQRSMVIWSKWLSAEMFFPACEVDYSILYSLSFGLTPWFFLFLAEKCPIGQTSMSNLPSLLFSNMVARFHLLEIAFFFDNSTETIA